MPQPPGDRLAILERRKNVAARYVRGQTQWEIARAFEVDQGTISRDLAAIRAEWLESSLRDFGALKAEQLAKIDAVEQSAWQGWLKSQENAETLRAEVNDGRQRSAKISKGQAGDPRFLTIVLDCVRRRCEILGLDAQNEHARATNALADYLKAMSDEQVDGELARLEALRTGRTADGGAVLVPPRGIKAQEGAAPFHTLQHHLQESRVASLALADLG